MKKILIIFFLIGLIFTQEQTDYGKVSYKYYNDIMGQFYTEKLNVKYSLENDTSYMYYGEVLTTSAYLFTKKKGKFLTTSLINILSGEKKPLKKKLLLIRKSKLI